MDTYGDELRYERLRNFDELHKDKCDVHGTVRPGVVTERDTDRNRGSKYNGNQNCDNHSGIAAHLYDYKFAVQYDSYFGTAALRIERRTL